MENVRNRRFFFRLVLYGVLDWFKSLMAMYLRNVVIE